MRWVEHRARTEEIKNAFSILVGKPKGRDHSEEVGIDGRIIFRWIVKERGWEVVTWV
jgi:hypothetical protein